MQYTLLKCFTKQGTVSLIFFDDYSSFVSEAKHKALEGEGLKILAPKQMLQRLPIALDK